MKTLAVITGERKLIRPFEIYDINEKLRVMVCRCLSSRRLSRKMKKADVCGYICDREINLPFKRYDGKGIFCLEIPALIKKLVKTKNIGTESVAVISRGNEDALVPLFEDIADMFREFYIISPDYDYAHSEAERLLNEYGIAAQTDEPHDICDVEIFPGSSVCGLGRCVLNYKTEYAINHGYNLPVPADSRAFAEALLVNGIISEGELKEFAVYLT